MNTLRLVACASVLASPLFLLTDCELLGATLGTVGLAACPELRGNVDVLSATFSADVKANGKIRAFVSASKDLLAMATQAEAEAAEACLRIGADLGMNPAELQPRNETAGRATGACGAVGARLDAILRQGLRFEVSVTPPQCQASVETQARCSGSCQGAVQGPQGDAECNASCNAQADLRATCTPIAVMVRPSIANPMALQLAASLQANLPQLLHAEWVLGKRVLQDAEVIVKVGQNLPGIVGDAGVRALACVGAAAEASVQASLSIKVTVQVSAGVSGRAGVGG